MPFESAPATNSNTPNDRGLVGDERWRGYEGSPKPIEDSKLYEANLDRVEYLATTDKENF